jgi:hypothetical protein
MGLSITESRSDLLAEARAEFNRAAALKASITGQKAESLPPDTVLIATDPTLSEKIQAADAVAVTTSADTSMAAVSAGVAATSSGSSDKTSSAASGAATPTASGSSAPNGQVLNVTG